MFNNIWDRILDLNKIKKRIREVWKTFFGMLILMCILFGISLFFIEKERNAYIDEFSSTTWYEEEAIFYNSTSYSELDSDGNREYYYNNYYNYVGKDGKTYTYSDKKSGLQGYEGQKIMIYVDENDNSHSLEIRDVNEDDGEFMGLIYGLIMAPFLGVIIVFLSVLYILKFLAIQKEKEKASKYVDKK